MSTIAEKTKNAPLRIIDCGLADYQNVLQQQHELHKKRLLNEIPDTILITEHRAVITLGARQSANKLRTDIESLKEQGIDVVEVRRGGGTTAHNPGQIVFYPILNLRELGLDISEYIRKLEAIGIELLGRLGIAAERRKEFPGLWVNDRKIASIGVRVSKSVTYHGMAINIKNDLSIFDHIVPCGLEDVKMTNAQKELGKKINIDNAKNILKKILLKYFTD